MNKVLTTAKAVVTLTVEVTVGGGGWGDTCTVAQVHKQATDMARGAIENAVERHDIKIVGTPKIEMITTTRESK